MSDLRDKIAEIVQSNCMENKEEGYWDAAYEILAVLPDMVPDLVWDMQSPVSGTAATSFGEYLVETCHEEGFGFWCPLDYKEDEPPFGYFETLEQAKAAANAHHCTQLIKEMGWTI